MLKFLFGGLTADISSGAALFDALTDQTRRPHWYIEGAIPDTLDGRFAVLATIVAITMVRLESEGDTGIRASVALTERFVEVMESEHRELGIGDPTLGRTVRKLVGGLARRTALWRAACTQGADWFEATRESLYKGKVEPGALRHCAEALKAFWERLSAIPPERLEQGKFA